MLDELIIEACDTKNTIFIRPLLSIFERFPEHDGHGIFWSIIHGLEYIGDYEQDLLQSVLTSPNEFNYVKQDIKFWYNIY